MSKRHFSIRFDYAALALIVLLGAWLRFRVLSILPLNNAEAVLALSAAEGTPGASEIWDSASSEPSSSPLYSFLTWVVFMLLPASDAVPRLIPAAAGTLLVFLPWMFREKAGRLPVLLASFLIAVSPLLVTISRTASSAMLSVTAISGFVIAFWRMEQSLTIPQARKTWAATAAVSAGLIITSGPESLTALLIFGITMYLLNFASPADFMKRFWQDLWLWLRETGIIVLVTVVFIASGAGFRTSGAVALFHSAGQWITGWGTQGGYSPLTGFASIFIYEPIWLVALACIVLAMLRRSRDQLLLLFLFISASLVYLFYPARTGTGLVWIVLTLILLSVYFLMFFLAWLSSGPDEEISLEMIGAGTVLFVLMIFAYLQTGGYVQHAAVADMAEAVPRLGIALGAVVTGIVVLVFFGFGWGWKFALKGGSITASFLLLCAIISSIWHLNFLPSSATASEFWRVSVSRQEIRSFLDSMENISIANTGDKSGLTVYFEEPAPPALAWHLRRFPAYKGSENALLENTGPDIFLSPVLNIPVSLPSAYTGRTSTLFERKGWLQAFPPNLLRWWYKRQAPVYYEEWTLLVRSDLMFVEMENLIESDNLESGEGIE
ncbi:MAG: hypothetical protein JXA25_07860 [Anaerolineales bacterium]|nr:hypothetical protein [Anaerolineales bacterium]